MFGININKQDYNSLKESYNSLDNELAMANKTITRYGNEIDEYKSTIETMATKHSVEIEELKYKLQKTEKSVNAKVNCALASVGVTNFAVETLYNSVELTPQEALIKFQALTGGDKTEFYQKNKELITKALSFQQ